MNSTLVLHTGNASFFAVLLTNFSTTWGIYGKSSAQPHTIVKQICFPNGNVLLLSLFFLSTNWMHNVVWGYAEILPYLHTQNMHRAEELFCSSRKSRSCDLDTTGFWIFINHVTSKATVHSTGIISSPIGEPQSGHGNDESAKLLAWKETKTMKLNGGMSVQRNYFS